MLGRLLHPCHHEHDVCAAAPTETYPVSVSKRVLRHCLVIDEGAIPGATVVEHIAVAGADNLGVVSGHLGAWQVQITPDTTPDQEGDLLDGDNPTAKRVADFESWVRHEFVYRQSGEGSSYRHRRRSLNTRSTPAAASMTQTVTAVWCPRTVWTTKNVTVARKINAKSNGATTRVARGDS